jgi:hypothetical protein
MGITHAIAVGSVQLFKLRLLGRMQALTRETGESGFLMPVALLFLADQANGGAVSGRALGERFNLTDFEYRNLIEFVFPGWSVQSNKGLSEEPSFEVGGFEALRRCLSAAGVRGLAGKSELILVDANHVKGVVRLNFSSALRVPLNPPRDEPGQPPIANLLQGMTAAVAAMRTANRPGTSTSFTVSPELDLATSRGSLLEVFLERLRLAVGWRGLAERVVRNLGPDLPLIDL